MTLLTLVVLLTFLSPLHALVKSHDFEHVVDPRSEAHLEESLNSIGRFSGPAGRHAVAFLLGNCHILTVRHVAFSDPNRPDARERSTFQVGRRKGRSFWFFEDEVQALPTAWGGQNNLPVQESPDGWRFAAIDDWTVLELEPCLANGKYTPLAIVPQAEALGAQVITLSHAGEPDPKQVLWDQGGQVQTTVNNQWFLDSASEKGDSGGPVLHFEGQKYQVWAMMSYEDLSVDGTPFSGTVKASENVFNHAVPIVKIYDQIKPYMF